jgi:hypothetical protein
MTGHGPRAWRVLACVAALGMWSRPLAAQAAVTGTVYLDCNGNGVRDAGETGVANVSVSNQDAVVRTGVDGRYQLPDRGLGSVFVSVPRHHRAVGAWWKPVTGEMPIDFALAPQREPVPFTFVQASDTHIAPASVPRTRRMIAVVDSLKPAMLLITGDLVRDALRVGEAEAAGYYTLFAQEMQAVRVPFFTVPGNHEVFGIERAQSKVDPAHPLFGRGMYRARRGPDYYSFDAGGVHFVALNTVDIDDQWYHGHVDSLQLAWLARDLSFVPDSVPVVTFNHIPMVSTGEQLGGYSEAMPAPTLITVKGKTQFRHTVVNLNELLGVLGTHRWEIALGGHVHFRETIALELGGRALRFHQTAAVVSATPKGRLMLPSGVTLYTIRNGHVDDGRFVPLDAVRR